MILSGMEQENEFSPVFQVGYVICLLKRFQFVESDVQGCAVLIYWGKITLLCGWTLSNKKMCCVITKQVTHLNTLSIHLIHAFSIFFLCFLFHFLLLVLSFCGRTLNACNCYTSLGLVLNPHWVVRETAFPSQRKTVHNWAWLKWPLNKIPYNKAIY